MSQPRLAGTLSLYPLPSWERRPFFTSGDEGADRAVIFIGGLQAGLLDAPFLVPLSRALGAAGWRFVQLHWSGAYDGFGTGSLTRDCDEMEALVSHLMEEEGVRTVVLAGHSTGAQDVMHYLTSKSRRKVAGGILISPASDREAFEQHRDPLWVEQLTASEVLIADGRGDQLMDERMAEAFGARLTAYRLHSLIGVGGDDDYFSADIPDVPDGSRHAHPLSESFGRLAVPVRALWMEEDSGALVDQRELLRRWEAAGRSKLSWTVVEGATHCVEEEGAQETLCEDVTTWLSTQVG